MLVRVAPILPETPLAAAGSARSTASPLLRFYRGQGTDSAGRRIEDIWNWDHSYLEAVHDFVQWLFPLPDPSMFNPDAPLLDENDRAAFVDDSELRARMLRSLDLLLDFYGLRRSDGTIERTAKFDARCESWLHPNNHNHLRISRILQSLRLCGLEDESTAFLDALEAINQEFPGRVTGMTLSYWRHAAGRGG